MQEGSARKRILGYTTKLTVRPGEHIEFKVSVIGSAPYAAKLVRLINGDVYSKSADFKEIEVESQIDGVYPGREQSIVMGSCIVVEQVGAIEELEQFTIVVNFMPTMPLAGPQHLISRRDFRSTSGWSLQIDGNGRLSFIATDSQGVTFSLAIGESLTRKKWYAAALRLCWRSKSVRLECRPIGAELYKRDMSLGSAIFEELGGRPRCPCPLLMAAAFGGYDGSGRVIPAECFDGRLEAPVIYNGCLSDEELYRVVSGERPPHLSRRLIADWDFSDGIGGAQIKDCSVNELNGYIHNLPLRAVKSSRWNGCTMEWRHEPRQYAAIHFHRDDLYDCGWLTDICYSVPLHLRSGIYALRLRVCTTDDSIPSEEYLPFFVAAREGAPQAKVAVMIPTHTYLAYANIRGFEEGRKKLGLSMEEYYTPPMMGPGMMEYALLSEAHPELGGSLYDHHLDGSPVHFSSCLRPILNVRPKSMLWGLCADLLLIDWLEAQGFDYDVITDNLVQEEGYELLRHYPVLITGNHPEYSSTEQLNAMQSYLAHGGHLMYLGGNGCYWRIATCSTFPGVIEVRRGRAGTGMWQSEVGESCLALTGELCGIWRELGRPPQRLLGVGFIAQGRGASHYRVVPEARQGATAFILEGVKEDVIGDFGIFEGYAAGQEIDRTNAEHGTPPQAVVVARSENHGSEMLYVIEEMNGVTPLIEEYRHLTCAEVCFFDTKNGGAVFAVGSMAWNGCLGHNGTQNNVSRITKNVLNQFLTAPNESSA